MEDKSVESLMIQNGFTTKEIDLLKRIATDDGKSLCDQLKVFRKMFLKIIYVYALILVIALSVSLPIVKEGGYGGALVFLAAMCLPLIVFYFIVPFKLAYKSFILFRHRVID